MVTTKELKIIVTELINQGKDPAYIIALVKDTIIDTVKSEKKPTEIINKVIDEDK